MEKGITKQHSQVLYGIAILLMLYHHMFCIPDRLGCDYFSLLGGVETKLAWFAKICVAIYAFISGYAASKFAEKSWIKRKSLREIFWENCKYSTKRILSFMKKFWIVFLIFVPMGVCLGSVSISFQEFLKGLFAYNLEIYNAEWWYVNQYLLIMVMFPILDLIVSKIAIWLKIDRRRFLCLTIITIILFIALYVCDVWKIRTSYWDIRLFLYYSKTSIYCIIFCLGYIFAKFRLYEFEKLACKAWMEILIAIMCIASSFLVRTFLATEAFYSLGDILIIAPIILGFCILSKYLKKFSKVLMWIGKFSTYMWLTHTFYCYYYFREFITVSKISIIMYLQLVMISLLTAVVLTEVEKLIDRLISKSGQLLKDYRSSWHKLNENSQRGSYE